MSELKTDNENKLRFKKNEGRKYVVFHDKNVKIKKRKRITIF